jgi:hypothetical protein
MAYGAVTLRQFVYLDLLVCLVDMPKVKNLLLHRGYKLGHTSTPKQEEKHLRFTCEFFFSHPYGTMIDVHWRFATNYMGSNLDPETLCSSGADQSSRQNNFLTGA